MSIRMFSGARITARLLGHGVFLGLLTLAVAIAIVSFLTACICDKPFVAITSRGDPLPAENKTTTTPYELPITSPPSTKKDN